MLSRSCAASVSLAREWDVLVAWESVIEWGVSKILATSSDSTVKLWNTETGMLLRTLAGHVDTITALVFTPDSRAIATGSLDKNIKIWGTSAGQLLGTLSQHVYPRTPSNETVVANVRSIMTARGDSAKNIWITECGWPTYTNALDPNAVSLATQAQYLTNLFTRLAGYSYVRAGLWYNLRSFDET